MSLYNALHGFEPTAQIVLAMLDLEFGNIPRFRDAYFSWVNLDAMTDPVAIVLTRTGGGNRSGYVEENEAMRKVAGYRSDRDDDFDSTFALFTYSVPEAVREAVETHLRDHGVPLTLKQKTDKAVESLKESEQ